LPSLRPDFVKLDRALVDGGHADRVKAVIVQRLVQMAHELGIRVVVEGVEVAEDLEWLQANAVDFVQGFLLARPAAKPRGASRGEDVIQPSRPKKNPAAEASGFRSA